MGWRRVNIVLTRESGMNGELRAFTPPSALVREVPLTRTEYRRLSDVKGQLEASGHYGLFASLVVTSARSGDYVETAMQSLKRGASVFSVGRATTRLLLGRGVTVTGEAASTSRDLADFIHRGPVVLLGAAQMRHELPDALRERELEVVHVACYETVPVELSDFDKEALLSAHVVFIGAPSAWLVARDYVTASAWVVVPGATTRDVVRCNHQQVLEGWEPAMRDVLASLEV